MLGWGRGVNATCREAARMENYAAMNSITDLGDGSVGMVVLVDLDLV